MSEGDRLKIRPARKEDREAARRIFAQAFGHQARLVLWPWKEFHVAEWEGEVAGIVGLIVFSRRRVAYLHSLAVGVSCRNRGIGQALLQYCETRAQASGCSKVWLCVRQENAPAKRLYERAGFHLCAEKGRWERLIEKWREWQGRTDDPNQLLRLDKRLE